MNNKVAILFDGAFFRKRFYTLNNRNPRTSDVQDTINDVMTRVTALTVHQNSNDILFRAFYYDCRPFGEKKKRPNGTEIDFSNEPSYRASSAFQNDLKLFPQMALRLGDLSFDGWKIDDKNPGHFKPDFKQKSVDIKIGLDIAWMSSKKTVDKLVLIAGDSDFVSPMKFARKEGILVYLYHMEHIVKMSLKEHADFIL